MIKLKPNKNEKKRESFFKKIWQKFRKWWKSYHWWVMIIGGVIAFVLGIWGFREYFSENEKIIYNTPDILYRTFQLFVLSLDSSISCLSWQLETARWLAPLVAGYTAVRALMEILREQFQLFKILFMSNHVIICGLGNKGLLLAQKFIDNGDKVVAIELDKENDNIKECKDKGVVVLIGNALASYILRRAGLNKAKYLLPFCGQDDINAEIAIRTRKLMSGKRTKRLTCMVNIADPHLCRLLKERELDPDKNNAFMLEFFNIFDLAAKTLINDEELSPFMKRKENVYSCPHLLIIGAEDMGENLIVQIARQWMDLKDKPKKKLKISIIDKKVKQRTKLFHLRYPHLKKKCKLTPLEMDIKSKDFEEGNFLFSYGGKCNFSIIYICLSNYSLALSGALILHNLLRQHDIPIVAIIGREAGLANLFQGEDHGFARLYGFGILDRVLKPELPFMGTHEILAHAIHEEYLRDRFLKRETRESNPSLIPWNELSEDFKESNRRQANSIEGKLKDIGCYIEPLADWNPNPIRFTCEEIESMAEKEHEKWKEWMEEYFKNEWRYDPGEKNDKKKTHPCLLPWDELPEKEKDKDRNTVSKIPDYLSIAGFQIYRKKQK